jgi:DNA-binding XRE family transcriptional regulator
MIKDKIRTYISEYGVAALTKRTGVVHSTFYKILKWEKIVQIRTLDILYHFFHEDKDLYYYKCMRKWNKEHWKNLGAVLRRIRIYKWISLDDLAYKSKLSKKQIIQIEKWKITPYVSTLQLLIVALDIPDEDYQQITKIRKNEKVIENIMKKYQIT